MFNPFKVQLSCQTSIPAEEREKFLEFLCDRLRVMGCYNIKKKDFEVSFSSSFVTVSRSYERRWSPLRGVDGGTIALSPSSNLIIYEFRTTTLAIMWIFSCFGSLFFRILPNVPWIFPLFIIAAFTIWTLANMIYLRLQQKNLLQQLETEYQQMKQVFAQPR